MPKPHHFATLTFCLLFLASHSLTGQDSLSVGVLSPFTHTFTIENGKLTGDGADFLRKEMSKSQFTMLGEYHGSANISEFTAALIPDAHEMGYRNFILEVGPITAQKLTQTKNNKAGIESALASLIQKHGWKTEDGVDYPIPFFSNIEDAPFLAAALSRNWKLVGVDQEFIHSYFMLVDFMFEQLGVSDQELWSPRFDQLRDTMSVYYQADLDSKSRFSRDIDKSEYVQSFFDEISEFEQVEPAATALRKSVEIYRLNADRKWFENNSTRVRHMKENFRQQVEDFGIDLSREKALAKMGGIHLSKGMSSQGVLDMGSLLNELAEYHGNNALNLSFDNRFEEEDGEVTDALDSEWVQLPRLIQLGRMDEWVVVDLRPLIPGYDYYPQKYLLDNKEWDHVRRYDLMIIAPLEKPATPNY